MAGLAWLTCADHRPPPLRPVPHVRALRVSPEPPREVLEFQLPAELSGSHHVMLLIGSLGDAGCVDAIELCSSPTELSVDAPVLVRRDVAPRTVLPVAVDTSAAPIRLVSSSLITPTAERPLPAQGKSPSAASPCRRVFFLQTGTNPQAESSYAAVSTQLTAETARCRIWQDLDESSPAMIDDFANWLRETEDVVLGRVTELYGPIADLDEDGKLAICVTPRIMELPAHGTPVEGLTQVNDFQPELPRPFSNQADVMFLSSRLRPGRAARVILAHEAAHLAVFSRRQEADPSGLPWDDDWLNEGWAHFAEIEVTGDWSNLDHRLDAYQRSPGLAPLVVTDAMRQGLWRQPGSRAAAWLFLRWLADEFGTEAVTEAARAPATGCGKIADVVQVPWPELFRRWSLAVWRSPPAVPDRIDCDAPQAEFSLRGTAHQAVRLPRSSLGTTCWRITAPSTARLQVTLWQETDPHGPVWIVR